MLNSSSEEAKVKIISQNYRPYIFLHENIFNIIPNQTLIPSHLLLILMYDINLVPSILRERDTCPSYFQFN